MELNPDQFDVVWTRTAYKSFDLNLEFIKIKWNIRIAERFLSKTDAVINKIQLNPLLFPGSIVFTHYHKAVIHKNTTLFYRIQNQKIYLILFWDNRQDPKFLKEILSKI